MKKIILTLFTFIASICFVSFPHNLFAFMDEIPKGLKVKTEYTQVNENIISIVELDIASNYYAYALDNAQDVGMPTQLVVKNTVGEVLPSYFPKGVKRYDYYEKDKEILAYTGKVYLFTDLGILNGNIMENSAFTAELTMLLCSKEHCLPVRIPLTLTVPKTIPSLSHDKNYIALYNKAKELGNVNAELVTEEPSMSNEQVTTNQTDLSKKLETLQANKDIGNLNDSERTKESGDAQKEKVYSWNFSPLPFAESLEVSGLGKAILLGLLAGFILNLMPCVLPVLTLKMHSLLRSENEEERVQAFRTHNLYFAAGIIAQFFILALILGSAKLMWGELFQNLYFVASMLVIIFALSLSLLGVFTLPIMDLKSSSTGSPRRQAFITGMVATLLATPCSGPLLGGVLSFALLQPLHMIVLIITTVGFGMSLPYLIFAIRPQSVRFLPKPGAWMGVLEKVVAFFLLGTAIYIFSILPAYTHTGILATLLAVAFFAWLFGHFGSLSAPTWRRHLFAGMLFISMFLSVIYGIQKPQISEIKWQNFTAEEFTANLGKKSMLVEFTADWCPNCKFVEKTVLTDENLQKWHKEYDLTFIRVDFTSDNAEGEALLHALGSKSIPFTAIFQKGAQAHSPIVIRDIYTTNDLEDALKQSVLPAKPAF